MYFVQALSIFLHVCLLQSAMSFSIEADLGKLGPNLKSIFLEDSEATQNIFVEFRRTSDEVLDMFEISTDKRGAGLHDLYEKELKLMARESQESIVEFLVGKSNHHKSYWLTNQLFVKDASKELVEAIGSYANVAKIRKEKIFHILKPVSEGPVTEGREGGNVLSGSSIKAIEWNVNKIKAPDMWNSANGANTVVGVIDTGVRSTHECFAKGAVIDWMDAINGRKTPYDDNGHGTHVTGTILGTNGIGVAPGATTIHCKACTSEGACPESAITSCCQFMTEKRPNVVSNSWGGPSGDAAYASVINGWKVLNIFSCFAAGNEGPSCSTIGSPADYSTVGCSVGATTNSDGIADFSSRGHCLNGKVGPTVSAPGQGIKSAWKDSDKSYKSLSGTSMATPHVSGMYALLHSANPSITFEQAQAAIVHSCAASGLKDPSQTCGGTAYTTAPNNMYGFGRIDCQNGVKMLNNFDSNGNFIL